MAEQSPIQRKAGTTSVSEQVERDWLKFENVEQFNAAYIEKISQAMFKRWKLLKGMTQQEATQVAGDMKTGYITNFTKFWSARGMTVDGQQAEQAWSRRILEPSLRRFQQLRMQASAPPLPPQHKEATIEVEPLPEEESESILSKDLRDYCSKAEWLLAELDAGTLGRFNAGFVPLLADIFDHTPDPAMQAKVAEAARERYASALLPMYLKSNEGIPPEQLVDTFKHWITSVWPNLELSAHLHRP